MIIISAKPYIVDENPNNIEHIIEANDHINALGHIVTDQLVIAHSDELGWFVTFHTDGGTYFRTFHRIDRKIWQAVWGEFRQLCHEDPSNDDDDWEPIITAEDLAEWQAASAGMDRYFF